MGAGSLKKRVVLKIRKKIEAGWQHTNTHSLYMLISRGLRAAAALSIHRCGAAGVVPELSHLQRWGARTDLLGPKSKFRLFCARWLIFTAISVVLRAATLRFGDLAPSTLTQHAAAPALAVHPDLLTGAPARQSSQCAGGPLLVC